MQWTLMSIHWCVCLQLLLLGLDGPSKVRDHLLRHLEGLIGCDLGPAEAGGVADLFALTNGASRHPLGQLFEQHLGPKLPPASLLHQPFALLLRGSLLQGHTHAQLWMEMPS